MNETIRKLVDDNGLEAVLACLADVCNENGGLAASQGDAEDAEAWYTAAAKLDRD